ncbi:class I SAM-dependent methyltransferase [Streptomyces afghaniensis]|uniref:class I SAM-dependent methyltransferase n=1 Tax=Streptomyces afghaniensis TaxID=66865 RepID=UPI0033B094AB
MAGEIRDGGTATNRLPKGSGVEIFEAHYAGVPGAGWEINRPQPRFVELAERGAFHGKLLDVGCGSGENALMAAGLGLDVTGVDAAPTAIALADRKARKRGLDARFLEWNVLQLGDMGEQFDTVIDVGLFHCFTDADRPALVSSIAAAVRPGGRYFLMCFSDLQPGTWGPRRVSESEIRESFASGWRIDALRRDRIEVTFEPGTAQAWLVEMTRLPARI